VKKQTNAANIAIILLLLILVPALLYTAYELSSLNESEELFGEIYNRQLDAILFSVNQYAWDVVNNWANSVAARGFSPGDSLGIGAAAQNAAMPVVFRCDSTGTIERLIVRPTARKFTSSDSLVLVRSLTRNTDKLTRLVRYGRTGYRKLEPLLLGDSLDRNNDIAIVFSGGEQMHHALIGFMLYADEFSRSVLLPKLKDVARNEFVLVVLSKSANTLVMSTDDSARGEIRQQKALWLFPNHVLGIRLKGTTIEEIVRARATRNIVLIILLDVVLVIGAWFVYRSIRREMELVRVKANFVSNVSHELRTPLALIRMFGETLQMGRVKSDEKRNEYYSTIVSESERLTRLVNNILDFSKMEAGKKQYALQDVQVNDVVRNVLATYQYHLHSEGFEPAVNLDASLPIISADPEAVTEAVVNLIDNAIKYSSDDKHLAVYTRATESFVTIEVEDHGVGIADEHKGKVFDTFFRVGSAVIHNTKGSGLGLALVKHIMDAHGGRIELKSEVNKGSTFRLLFPRTKSSRSNKGT